MANTFLAARGCDLKASLVEERCGSGSRATSWRAPRERGVEVLLPVDLVVADDLAEPGRIETVAADAVPDDMKALDIGPATRKLFAAGVAARAHAVLERSARRLREAALRRRHARGGGRPGRRRRLHRLSAAARRWRRRTRPASSTASITSRPAAEPRSSSSPAAPCPASPSWRPREKQRAPAARRRQLEDALGAPRRARLLPGVARGLEPGGGRDRPLSIPSRSWRRSPRPWPKPGSPSAARICTRRKRAPTPATSPAPQLRDAGCAWALVGHSERRRDHGETDELVGLKVAAAERSGLVPLLCVGESRAERRAGDTLAVLERQLRAGLASRPGRFAVAYEPVWAIGTGETATPETAQEAHAFLRRRSASSTARRWRAPRGSSTAAR